MSTAKTIEAQFMQACAMADIYHGLLNSEISKNGPCMDALVEYADKLRDAVSLMRILDGILDRQATADALAVLGGRAAQ